MATIAALDAEIAAKLEALSEIGARMASDWRTDREPIPSASASYQLRVWRLQDDQRHSGLPWARVRVEVDVHQLALTQADERPLLLGAVATVIDTILARDWWNVMAAVSKVVDDGDDFPIVTVPPQLIVRVLTYGVAVELYLAP